MTFNDLRDFITDLINSPYSRDLAFVMISTGVGILISVALLWAGVI